ncbi:AraC family transcriptional regulator [Halovulum sp. GXIMD14794]
MNRRIIPITTATGMGDLPALLEDAAGSQAIGRAFSNAQLPLQLIEDRRVRVPMAALVELFAGAGRQAGDRLLGLRIGLDMKPADYGRWAIYSQSGRTLREGVARLNTSLPLHQLGPWIGLETVQGQEMLVYRMPRFGISDKRQHSDHVVPSLLKFIRGYLGESWSPSWVQVDYPDDGCAARLADLVPTDWRFGSDALRVPLSANDLDTPRITSAPAGGMTLTSVDLVALEGQQAPSFKATVEACIAMEMVEGQTTIDGVARRMGMSVRSLQRALDQDGLGFRDLLDLFRLRKATELLSHGELSVTEIALSLGYNDPGNFSRAFRRWTGFPPSMARRTAAE